MGLKGIYLSILNGLNTILTTKGDLLTFSTTSIRLGVGANDTVLTADSAQASGIKWAALPTRKSVLATQNNGGQITDVATTNYLPVMGPMARETTELKWYLNMPFAATIKNAYTYIVSNASTTAVTITSRKNGADQAIGITITALTTGAFSDTTNSYTVVAGDLINYAINGTTVGNITASSISCEVDST